jgi:demethylmenaquinone methyltransferase/2-methoxy-6-polyprenyl-1,4-benzoquinol methylase
MSRANLNKDPDEVAAMFDGVAKRYDLVNDLLSLGRTKAWRKAATKIIAPQPGMVILDLAAGPGSSSEPLFKAGAKVFATDFSEGMLAQGRKARPYLRRIDLMWSLFPMACETPLISTKHLLRPAA